MPSSILWLCLVCMLSISTFGIWLCSLVLVSFFFVVVGWAVMLYASQTAVGVSLNYYSKRNNASYAGLPKILQQVNHPLKHFKYDQRLTGSMKIDEPLQEIIHYIIRDNIRSWYNEMSSNSDFINCIKELLQKVINNVANSAKEVDWVQFLTRKMVDDFASHLRLYRQSEKIFKKSQREDIQKYLTIESVFFDLETTMEKNLCRDFVCTSEEHEKRYMQYLCDILLYLILPPEDFHNKILRYFLREILVFSVFLPVIALFSDPDYINQNIVWLLKDYPITSKNFLTVLRRSDSIDELMAVQGIAYHELKVQKAKDTGDKDEMKQNIKSINFVKDIAEQRLQRLRSHWKDADTDSMELSIDIDWKSLSGPEAEMKLFSLPFDIVLNNNIGLHYFSEFMNSIGAQGYVFFYHSIEGYRTSAETILSEQENTEHSESLGLEKLRDFALHIFDSYLGDRAVARVKLDELLLKKLLSRIKTEKPCENWFDETQTKVYELMQEEFYCTGFKNSSYYIKLLAELDLLHDLSSKGDDENDGELECKSVDENLGIDLASENEDVVITELLNVEVPSSEFCFSEALSPGSSEVNNGEGILCAEVYSTGVTHHAGKTFAVYAVAVTHHRFQGPEERWFLVRRYSEFHELHESIMKKYPHLTGFSFPSKKAFNNLSRHLMEKRRFLLNEYIQFLLSEEVLSSCDGLKHLIYKFLEPRVCEKGKKSFIRTVGGTLVNPIKSSVKTVGHIVKLVPGSLFELKDGLVKALAKSPSSDSLQHEMFETDKVSAGLNIEADNIPMRIMLLLMDEIFDLKNKDLWFRRRIVALLRQIIKTTYGDTINRKIIDYVKSLTSSAQVAEWLKLFRQAFWPNGVLAPPSNERDYKTKMRTRVAAKCSLLCSIPDELKHIIGSETSCKGAMVLFSMLQHTSLNRRLVYVILESCIEILFPKNNFRDLFCKLHSESPRLSSINISSSNKCEISKKMSNAKKKGVPKTDSSKSRLTSKQEKCEELVVLSASKSKLPKKIGFQCISHQGSGENSPKLTKKVKSLETAVFYTDTEYLSLSGNAEVHFDQGSNSR